MKKPSKNQCLPFFAADNSFLKYAAQKADLNIQTEEERIIYRSWKNDRKSLRQNQQYAARSHENGSESDRRHNEIEKDEIIYMSITELAMRLGVSEATILRFCRKIDYRGFQDFKLSLSQEAGGGNTSDESDYMKNIVYDMTDAITETYKALDENNVPPWRN